MNNEKAMNLIGLDLLLLLLLLESALNSLIFATFSFYQ